jgi:predicted MPP superfamily phosphohydrolase
MIFRSVPERVALTLCGHTHGGQINLPLFGPVIGELRFGADVYGHVVRDNRHLIISGGLGESVAPIRFMRPPEIVEVTLGAAATVSSEIRRA